jgi:aralkylamine N-acetyltransferase
MCVLRVSSNRETLAEFLSNTQIPFYESHDKNTLVKRGRKKGQPYGHAGFQSVVSKKEWDDLPGQIQDAIRFLQRYQADLTQLRNKFNVADVRLDFPYNLRIGRNNIAVQFDFLPAALISLAGGLGIGITMSLWPAADRPGEPKAVALPGTPSNGGTARPGCNSRVPEGPLSGSVGRSMKALLTDDPSAIDWERLALVFKSAPLGLREPAKLRKTFMNSAVRCFAWDGDHLIGAGRAITDGVAYAAIFDVVLLPEYQGKGIGKQIMTFLASKSKAANIILHSVPGKEEFYRKLGYRRMKTAMGQFANPEKQFQMGYIE